MSKINIDKKKGFDKVLNSKDVLVTAFGAMIGWGWVVASGDWILNAGTMGTVIGFIIGGIMIYFVGLTYAELTTAMPKCGGEHLFSYKAFGSIGSFICTWAIILSYIGVVCFEACSLPTIIQYIFPGFLQVKLYSVAGFDIYLTWLITAIIFAILITWVNIRGIKSAAVMQTILTFIIAGVGILLIVMSTLKGDVDNLHGQFITENGMDSVVNILSIAIVAPFYLFGFDVIPQAAEEIKVPLKKLGHIMLLSIVLAVAFYSFVVIAIGISLNSFEITESLNSSGLVAADAMGKLFNSSTMSRIAIFGGLCGIVTSWNSFLIGGSRALYSMSNAYMIPRKFCELHPKYKTPINAVILVGFLSVIAPFFGRAVLIWISNVASFACCLAYCMVTLSFLVIRKKEPDLHRPYKVKFPKLIGVLAIIMSSFMMLMYLVPFTPCTMTFAEFTIATIWILLGFSFYKYSKNKYKDKFGNIAE